MRISLRNLGIFIAVAWLVFMAIGLIASMIAPTTIDPEMAAYLRRVLVVSALLLTVFGIKFVLATK